jgi:hypothetical protein
MVRVMVMMMEGAQGEEEEGLVEERQEEEHENARIAAETGLLRVTVGLPKAASSVGGLRNMHAALAKELAS